MAELLRARSAVWSAGNDLRWHWHAGDADEERSVTRLVEAVEAYQAAAVAFDDSIDDATLRADERLLTYLEDDARLSDAHVVRVIDAGTMASRGLRHAHAPGDLDHASLTASIAALRSEIAALPAGAAPVLAARATALAAALEQVGAADEQTFDARHEAAWEVRASFFDEADAVSPVIWVPVR